MAIKEDYDAGTAAALQYLRGEIDRLVPSMFRGMIDASKEPGESAAVAKVVIDAVDDARAKRLAAKP